eukprot:364875-Chlamydomonas_euryale.AAC.2
MSVYGCLFQLMFVGVCSSAMPPLDQALLSDVGTLQAMAKLPEMEALMNTNFTSATPEEAARGIEILPGVKDTLAALRSRCEQRWCMPGRAWVWLA